MTTIDPELQELYEIEATSYALYRYEVLREARFSREEEDELLRQARAGDKTARELLVRSCLGFVFFRAGHYVDQLRHDDPMDLVSIGNIALLEGLDKALYEADQPIKYLLAHAAYTMQHYVHHDSHLIKRDKHRNEVIPVTSLERELTETGLTLGGLIAAVADTVLSEAEEQQTAEMLYAPLYQAINQLTEKQRYVILKHFGLDGAPENLAEIGRGLSQKNDVIWKNKTQALKRLRKLLGRQ